MKMITCYEIIDHNHILFCFLISFVISGQTKAELEEKRIKTLEEI